LAGYQCRGVLGRINLPMMRVPERYRSPLLLLGLPPSLLPPQSDLPLWLQALLPNLYYSRDEVGIILLFCVMIFLIIVGIGAFLLSHSLDRCPVVSSPLEQLTPPMRSSLFPSPQ